MEKRNGFTPLEKIQVRKNKKLERANALTGFTLIELLVVIAIIALLLAILVPSLRKARNHAMVVVCQSRLKEWGTVFAMYADENDGHFFEDFQASWWLYCSFKYIKKPKIIWEQTGSQELADFANCPMAKETNNDTDNNTIGWGVEGTWHSGGVSLGGKIGSAFDAWKVRTFTSKENGSSGQIEYYGSYGLNIALVHDAFWISPSGVGGGRGGGGIGIKGSSFPLGVHSSWRGLKIYSLKRKSDIPVLLDCALPYSILYSADQPPPPTQADVEDMGCCINRHNEHVNSLFLDWSVRKVGLKELWKLKWHDGFNTNGPWTKAGGVQPEQWPEWMREFKDY